MSKNVHLKTITLGPLNCGKTCFVKRYCEEFFEDQYHPTIGIDYGVKVFPGPKLNIALSFFDLSGDNYFKDIRKDYYNGIDILMLFVDLTIHRSFDEMEVLFKEFQSVNGKSKYLKILIGTKSDQMNSQVWESKIQNFAKRNNFRYFQTSSLLNENVEEVFRHILSAYDGLQKIIN